MEGAKEDLLDMFIVHSTTEIQACFFSRGGLLKLLMSTERSI